MIEGVDYSAVSTAGWPAPGTLKSVGKFFAVRYLADDARGIVPPEFQAMEQGGVPVAAVFEGWGDQRQFSGWNQGVTDATYAQNKLLRTGMPATMPIYFATDWDATPADQANIDQYLKGCALVLGAERVGVYGGYWIVKRCVENGSAKWFWQTTAWSGGQVHPACHLYQYAYNVWIAGTNCDAMRALQDHYGQHTDYIAPVPQPSPTPAPIPQPHYPTPELPDWWADQKKLTYPVNRHWKGALWEASRGKSTVVNQTSQRLVASDKGRKVGPDLQPGDVVMRERVFTSGDGTEWIVLRAGGHGVEGARVAHADTKDTPVAG